MSILDFSGLVLPLLGEVKLLVHHLGGAVEVTVGGKLSHVELGVPPLLCQVRVLLL